MSIVSTSIDDSVEPNGLDMVSAFFSGVFGALSALFSLLTNAAATGMIALQAWSVSASYSSAVFPRLITLREQRKHRRLLDKYLRQNHARSQVVKALIMLVESGAVYCTLWTIVVIYAFTSTFGRKDVQAAAPAWYNLSFYLTNGCLISFVVRFPAVRSLPCKKLMPVLVGDLPHGHHCARLPEQGEDLERAGTRAWNDEKQRISAGTHYAARVFSVARECV